MSEDLARPKPLRWDCGVCGQSVESDGPWCVLYQKKNVDLCKPLAKRWLREADAAGDGPLVNRICEYGRRRWGPDLEW